MDNIIMAIVLRQIHMQAVEYILDDQMINSSKCGVVSSVFTNCRSFKKGAVVSEQHYFGYSVRYTCRQLSTYLMIRR